MYCLVTQKMLVQTGYIKTSEKKVQEIKPRVDTWSTTDSNVKKSQRTILFSIFYRWWSKQRLAGKSYSCNTNFNRSL